MTAGKRLPGFCAMVAILAVLLFFSSASCLLWILLILLGSAAASAGLLWIDSRRLRLELYAASGGRAGQPLPLTLKTGRTGTFWAASHMTVELDIISTMFDITEHRQLVLPLKNNRESYGTTITAELCGETRFCCTEVHLQDLLKLFQLRCAPFAEVRTVLYPQPAELELILSRDTVGAADAEGMMQNRPGNDPSEIFDVREYVPGDDIRTIHWKLSCKTDTLIVRQASDPSHYDVALLPDIGFNRGDRCPTNEELNSAVAVTIALGEQLLQQGTAFCIALPTRKGLHLQEIRSLRELHEFLPQWLGLSVQQQSGIGLQCFQSEHLEQHFTRLLLISAGRYMHDLSGLDRRIGVTAVSTVQEITAPAYTKLGASCEAVLLPALPKRGEASRIIC